MTTTTRDSDAALRGLFDKMLAAWTAGDASAYGECFTGDADYVSYDGTHTRGKHDMVDNHDRLFRGVLAGSALAGSGESIRYLGPEVAVLHATGSVLMPWRSALPKGRLSRQTIVAVDHAGTWLIAALHNGRVRPVNIPRPGAMVSRRSRAIAAADRTLRIGRTSAPVR
jgi:uncharacterized protein (TIGR02246 family)